MKRKFAIFLLILILSLGLIGLIDEHWDDIKKWKKESRIEKEAKPKKRKYFTIKR